MFLIRISNKDLNKIILYIFIFYNSNSFIDINIT